MLLSYFDWNISCFELVLQALQSLRSVEGVSACHHSLYEILEKIAICVKDAETNFWSSGEI